MTVYRLRILAAVALMASHLAKAQCSSGNCEIASNETSERWNLYYQATSIGQYHGAFQSQYSGTNSLQNYSERDASLTTTLYLGLRLGPSTQIFVNPEIAGGRGFSGVTGIANFPNGELPRVATATPKPYLARLYLVQDFALGAAKEHDASAPNQLEGDRPAKRYTIILGRFTVTDFFDNNRYSHDPRAQFMTWGTMYNGAWDYPADTRGYTWGWVHELHLNSWSFRYGSAAEPKQANGLRFDRRLFRDRSDNFEGEHRYALGTRQGAVRLLGFLNHTNSGNYQTAIQTAQPFGAAPDVTATRQVGTLKYGFGASFEQELSRSVGVFARLGWNDGKTESFAFTAIDRLASGGVAVNGALWKRPSDTAATALTASGLSRVHAAYLAKGGTDFIIGDGALRYGREVVWETYYNARIIPGVFATFDLQRVANPAFNRDRGPVWIPSLRLHIEMDAGKFFKGIGNGGSVRARRS